MSLDRPLQHPETLRRNVCINVCAEDAPMMGLSRKQMMGVAVIALGVSIVVAWAAKPKTAEKP